MQSKSVFLDRDGTIIIDKIYLNDPNQIEYMPNVFRGLKSLQDLGFKLIVVTNQSGLARGLVDIRNLFLIHKVIQADMASQGIDLSCFYHSPHSVESNHYTRKPNPGMLIQASLDHQIDLTKSWIIGDRMTDVEAGQKVGTRAILLNPAEPIHAFADYWQTPDLLEASQVVTSFADELSRSPNPTRSHNLRA